MHTKWERVAFCISLQHTAIFELPLPALFSPASRTSPTPYTPGFPPPCPPTIQISIAVACNQSVHLLLFCFVLFCYITNHLMTGSLGNSEFCFPGISMFPSTSNSSRESLRNSLFPSGSVIKCLLSCDNSYDPKSAYVLKNAVSSRNLKRINREEAS